MSAPKTENETIHKYPLAKVLISERNTRQPTAKEVTDAGMVASMKDRITRGENPQITPGIGRPHPTKAGCIELGAGARRRVALEAAGHDTYDVIIRPMDDQALDLLILTENFQREDPTPKAEAIAVQRLSDAGMDSKAIGAALGKPESWAARRMRLLKVIPRLFKSWTEGAWITKDRNQNIAHFSVEMMELVGSLPKETQEKLGKDDWQFSQSKCRTTLTNHLKNHVLCRLDVKWLDDPDTFVNGCGPGCAKDSRKEGKLLFDGEMADGCGTCLNTACFFARQAKANAKKLKEVTGGEDLPIMARGYSPDAIRVGDKSVKPQSLDWNMEVISAAALKKDPKLEAKSQKVVIIEDGELKVAFIKKKSSSSGGGGAAKKVASPKEREKAKVDMLQAKRWVLVEENLKKTLKESTWAATTRDAKASDPAAKDCTLLYDLVAVFGLPWKEDCGAGKDEWKMLDEKKFVTDPTVYVPFSKNAKTTTDRNEVLWNGVKRLLDDNFKHYNVTGVLDCVPHMRRVAALIAFPIDDEKKAADLKVLPPKSWGKVDPHTLKPVDKLAAMQKDANAEVKKIKARSAKKKAKGKK